MLIDTEALQGILSEVNCLECILPEVKYLEGELPEVKYLEGELPEIKALECVLNKDIEYIYPFVNDKTLIFQTDSEITEDGELII